MPSLSSKSVLVSLASAMAVVLVSCVNIAYDGDSRDPKAKRSEVQVFMDRSKISSPDYKILGQATASAPASYTASEVEQKLVDFAKKNGADGLLILSVDKDVKGKVRPDQALSVTPGDEASVEESSRVTIKALLLELPKKEEDLKLPNPEIKVETKDGQKDGVESKSGTKTAPIPID